jgi:type III secretion system low calcium response chaperone LcrH/SycD
MEEEGSFRKRVNKLNDMARDPEQLKKFQDDGVLFQQAFGFTEEQMENFYQFARRLCEHERFKDASDVFLVLTALNPYVSHFWLGLGLCDKIERDYKGALFDYSMAMAVDKENAFVYYNIADCYYRLGEGNSAEEFIEMCIDKCFQSDEYNDLEIEAKKFKEKLKLKR